MGDLSELIVAYGQLSIVEKKEPFDYSVLWGDKFGEHERKCFAAVCTHTADLARAAIKAKDTVLLHQLLQQGKHEVLAVCAEEKYDAVLKDLDPMLQNTHACAAVYEKKEDLAVFLLTEEQRASPSFFRQAAMGGSTKLLKTLPLPSQPTLLATLGITPAIHADVWLYLIQAITWSTTVEADHKEVLTQVVKGGSLTLCAVLLSHMRPLISLEPYIVILKTASRDTIAELFTNWHTSA